MDFLRNVSDNSFATITADDVTKNKKGEGEANVPGSKVGHYWVVMTAPPEGSR
ncbi:hypothetical protein N9021_01945 [Akkermansiaceae bacterium]|nr:hypothetical protein [Akkermansiaceae bacterium]